MIALENGTNRPSKAAGGCWTTKLRAKRPKEVQTAAQFSRTLLERTRSCARHQTDDWDRSIDRSIDQSTNQPINPSTNQIINQSTNQPINQSTNQPITSPSARVRMQYPNSRKCQKYQSQQQRVPRVGLTLLSVHHSYKSATVYCSKPAWGPSGQPLWRPC